MYEVIALDKYEYKVRLEEIEKLMDKGRYNDAVRLADSIDWQRVKSATTLLRIGELYKKCKRFTESRDLLEFAYDRNPSNKNVIYALCDLNIQFGDIVEAVEYYKEFARLVPRDIGVYTLRYKIYEAQNVGYDEKIKLLEELKKRDRSEEWEYELAYLYHRAGYATKCVEECDEIILWFGEGSYVNKAMELKMLHEPLTPQQQYKYDRRNDDKSTLTEETEPAEEVAPAEDMSDEDDFKVNTIEFKAFNTINLQEELAKNLEPYINGEPSMLSETQAITAGAFPKGFTEGVEDETKFIPNVSEDTDNIRPVNVRTEPEIDPEKTETLPTEETETAGTMPYEKGGNGVYHDTIPADSKEVFFDDKTGDIRFALPQPKNAATAVIPELDSFKESFKEEYVNRKGEARIVGGVGNIKERNVLPDGTVELEKDFYEPDVSVTRVKDSFTETKFTGRNIEEIRIPGANDAVRVNRFESILSEEGDGQISLAIPEERVVEKQITGQINIDDIMADWEKRKLETGERLRESTRQRVLEKTGKLFSDFNESARSGILASLDNPAIIDTVSPSNVVIDGLDASEIKDARQVTVSAPVVAESNTIAVSQVITPDEIEEIEEAVAATDEKADVSSDAGKAERGNRNVGWHENSAPLPTSAFGAETMAIINEGFTEEIKAAAIAAEAAEAAKDAEIAAAGATVTAATELKTIDGVTPSFTEITVPEEERDIAEVTVAEDEPADEPEEIAEEETQEVTEDVAETAEEREEEPKHSGKPVKVKPSDVPGSIWDEVENGQAEEDTSADEAEDDSEESEEIDESGDSDRGLSDEEKALFAPFLYSKKLREDIQLTLENLTMAAYVGNVVITSENEEAMINLAKLFTKYMQSADSNFSGKVAKVDSDKLNARKELASIFEKIVNGALIVEKAGSLSNSSLNLMLTEMNQEENGVIVFLLDKKAEMKKLFNRAPIMKEFFNCSVNIKAMTADKLVKFGCKYAAGKGYSIDEMASLAFYKRISDIQIGTHQVTLDEVKEIVDDAIKHCGKHSIFGRKKKDDEGYIVLREKDFN